MAPYKPQIQAGASYFRKYSVACKHIYTITEIGKFVIIEKNRARALIGIIRYKMCNEMTIYGTDIIIFCNNVID